MFQQLLHRASHHGLIWLGVPTEYQRRMFSQGNISPSTMPNSYETICALESMRASGQELPVVVVDANIAKRDRHCLAKTMGYLDDFSDLELILFGDQPSVKNRNLYRHVISSNSSFISGLDVVLPNDESVNSEPESDSASERVLLLENNSTRRLIAQGLLRSLSIEHDIMDDVPSFLDKDSYDVLLMSYEMLDLPGASELLKLANRAVIMGGEEQSDDENSIALLAEIADAMSIDSVREQLHQNVTQRHAGSHKINLFDSAARELIQHIKSKLHSLEEVLH